MLTPVPKRKTVKDKKAVKRCRKTRCEVCGGIASGDPHHIYSQGAGGPDIPENLIQLCFRCHYEEVPSGKLSRQELLEIVARREGKTVDEVESIIRAARGRG